jgi:hypothetical protein
MYILFDLALCLFRPSSLSSLFCWLFDFVGLSFFILILSCGIRALFDTYKPVEEEGVFKRL